MSTFSLGAGVQQTPGIYTRESDQTVTVSSGASTQNAFAGVFSWGPVNEPHLVYTEGDLVTRYGKPTNSNYETWFTAANFLAYADQLWINRTIDNTAVSAVANTAAVTSLPAHTVLNTLDYDTKVGSFETGVKFIAKYPGAAGNSLRVAVCGSAAQFSSNVNVSNVGGNTLFGSANTSAAFTVGSNVAIVTVANTAALAANTPLPYANTVASSFTVGDTIAIGNTSLGTQTVKITSIGTPVVANTAGSNTGYASIALGLSEPVKIADTFTTTTVARGWEFAGVVATPPTTTWSVSQTGNTAAVDGIHVVVVDEDGFFSGRANAILETYTNVSRASDAKTIDGDANFYKKRINLDSQYIWAGSDITGLGTANSALVASATTTAPTTFSFQAGVDSADEGTISPSAVASGYLPYANKDAYNLTGVIAGKTKGGAYGEQTFNWIIDNIGEKLQNVVVYGSPDRATSLNVLDPVGARRNFRSALRRSSYAVCDTGYKYMYDAYNDVYRFVPLCGDIAGLSARTDITNDPWISPAGFNRGQIKNIVRLAWSPNAAEQGIMFNELDLNNVVSIQGDGTYLMGDKTLLGQVSAFDSISVRKLFNIIKTAIAKASRSLLFENNDEFSQSRFRNLVEPYLRDILGRRGIEAFSVVCDDTNNTPQVKANKQFVGDIFIVPEYAARTIQLNFIGVNSLAEFNESTK